VLVVCFAVVIANLIADIVYAIIDPTVNLTGRRPVSLWSRLRVGRPQPPVESQGAQASS
jgi:hypothetical protein